MYACIRYYFVCLFRRQGQGCTTLFMLSQFLEKAQTRMKYREAIENAGAQGGAHKQTNHRLSASSCKLNSEEINSL